MKFAIKNRAELAEYFAKLGFGKGAEIGVLEGAYSRTLCEANPQLILYCIDSWGLGEGKYRRDRRRNYEAAKLRLAAYDTELIRKLSLDAVKDFEDGSLDFVYIDANHGFNFVVNDIIEWTKKVKRGGIVSGHDYDTGPGVKWAVDGYTINHHLSLQLTKPDNEPVSWWFVKKWNTD